MRGDLNSNVCKRYRAAKMADMAAIETAKKAAATKGEAYAEPIARVMTPMRWWRSFGRALPSLQPFAIRLMCAKGSNSATERNWSKYGHIHSSKRSRMSTLGEESTAEKSVYMFGNANPRGWGGDE